MDPDRPLPPRRLNPDFSARKGGPRSRVARPQEPRARPSLWEDPTRAAPAADSAPASGAGTPPAAVRAERPEGRRLDRLAARAPWLPPDLDIRARRDLLAVRLTVAAAVWSLGLLIAALVLPVYDTTVPTRDGTTFVSKTIVAGHGAWTLLPICVPLIVSLVVAVALRGKRAGPDPRSGPLAWTAIGILAAFALFSILWIGGFIIPVAILLAAATGLTDGPRRAPEAAAGAAPAPLSRAAAAPRDRGRAQPAPRG